MGARWSKALLGAGSAIVLALGACGDDSQPGGEPDAAMPDAGDAASAAPPMMTDAGSGCAFEAREHAHDSLPAQHVSERLDAGEYNSEPPSSGPHCDAWGQYAHYETQPLPACNFLHNLEHGAIALLYNCDASCPSLVAELEALLQAPSVDPDCAAPRLLLTSYSEMQATVAAAAWGYTWTAECLDAAALASLRDFIETHIGSRGDAPEPTVCQDGTVAP